MNKYTNIVPCHEGWRAVFLDDHAEDFAYWGIAVWALDAYGKVVGLVAGERGLESAEECEGFVAYVEPEENPKKSDRFLTQQREIRDRRIKNVEPKILKRCEKKPVTPRWVMSDGRLEQSDAEALLESMWEKGVLKRVDDPSCTAIGSQGFYYEKA